MNIPCETCITQAICKNRRRTYCNLLLKPYMEIENEEETYYPSDASRTMERLISNIFNWKYDNTYVYKTASLTVVVINNN